MLSKRKQPHSQNGQSLVRQAFNWYAAAVESRVGESRLQNSAMSVSSNQTLEQEQSQLVVDGMSEAANIVSRTINTGHFLFSPIFGTLTARDTFSET